MNAIETEINLGRLRRRICVRAETSDWTSFAEIKISWSQASNSMEGRYSTCGCVRIKGRTVRTDLGLQELGSDRAHERHAPPWLHEWSQSCMQLGSEASCMLQPRPIPSGLKWEWTAQNATRRGRPVWYSLRTLKRLENKGAVSDQRRNSRDFCVARAGQWGGLVISNCPRQWMQFHWFISMETDVLSLLVCSTNLCAVVKCRPRDYQRLGIPVASWCCWEMRESGSSSTGVGSTCTSIDYPALYSVDLALPYLTFAWTEATMKVVLGRAEFAVVHWSDDQACSSLAFAFALFLAASLLLTCSRRSRNSSGSSRRSPNASRISLTTSRSEAVPLLAISARRGSTASIFLLISCLSRYSTMTSWSLWRASRSRACNSG